MKHLFLQYKLVDNNFMSDKLMEIFYDTSDGFNQKEKFIVKS